MISTVAVDPFKFQSVTVQSVKSNKSPGTYRTYHWKKNVQVALHDGLQSWNVSMSCLVGWNFKGGSYQESGHSSWYLTKNMDKRAKTKVMLITWKNSPVHCFQLITIEIAMLSIGNRWKMTLGEFSKSVFGKWLRAPESQFHWCRGFFPQHYRRINWSIVETTTTQPPSTQGLVTCIISTVSTRTTSSVDPYGEGRHIKMKHGKTRCDESGETLGIIETRGSSSYVSDHIYKHLQALPFFPLTTVFPISPLDFPPMNTCQPKMLDVVSFKLRWWECDGKQQDFLRRCLSWKTEKIYTPENHRLGTLKHDGLEKEFLFNNSGMFGVQLFVFEGVWQRKMISDWSRIYTNPVVFFHSGEKPELQRILRENLRFYD